MANGVRSVFNAMQLAQVPSLPVSGLDRVSVIVVAVASVLFAIITNIDKIDAIIQRKRKRKTTTAPKMEQNAATASRQSAKISVLLLVLRIVVLVAALATFVRRYLLTNFVMGSIETALMIFLAIAIFALVVNWSKS